MLKKRIIANIPVRNGIVVQSINFKKYLPIGDPGIAVDFLNQWGIDEIILTDICASAENKTPNFEMIRKAASKCYVPMTVCGGIKHIDHIKKLMHYGADKISLNQAAIANPQLISEAAATFGTQCIVVAIDSKIENGLHKVYDHVLKKTLDISPALYARKMQEMGAGEILINSVDRDGSYKGYDIELVGSVCDHVSIPVICLGGAKNANDIITVFSKTNVSGAAAGNFFHFTEHSLILSKAAILQKHLIRLDTYADYKDCTFDAGMRLAKKDDTILEELLFLKLQKEII